MWGNILCISHNILCASGRIYCLRKRFVHFWGKILCISEIILCIFFLDGGGGGIFLFDEKFCISENILCIIKESCFVFQKNIWCNSRNILSIIRERFCVFKIIFCAFFKERFWPFFAERLCVIEKSLSINKKDAFLCD